VVVDAAVEGAVLRLRPQTVKRFVRKPRGPQCPEAVGIILAAAGEEAQVDYGSGACEF
jgi:hypothetical protein